MFLTSGGYGKGPGVGPGVILDVERSQTQFHVEEMTWILRGGKARNDRRRELTAIIEADPVFRKWDRSFLSRAQMYARGLEKTKRFLEIVLALKLTNEDDMFVLSSAIDEQLPVSLHHSMFIPTLTGQCNEEQKKKWLPKARYYQIIGTYAQTEMGHGSFVRGIETTATFDPSRDEFVLHTPTLTGTKWWPGNLGKTSTHCVVMARLITKGTDYGVHPFLVQLRSLKDHSPLEGIIVGDIGPKFGYDMNDNGFLRFDHVRIPRDQMLMRFASVAKDGSYTPAPHAKLSYSTMVFIRSWIVIGAARTMARACTIAVRYSAVRTQFPKTQGNTHVEEQILNYQTQQYLLFPLIATAYAFHFTGIYMKQLYEQNVENVKQGDVSLMQDVHATSSGLKALCTALTSDGIEVCRRSCGGHGYSRFNGLIDLFVDYVPAQTYEGENIVMYLQTARYLMKKLTQAQRQDGSKPEGILSYYHDMSFLKNKCKVQKASDWNDPTVQMDAFLYRAAHLAIKTKQRKDELINQGISYEVAWEQCKQELVNMARAHCYHVILSNFITSLKTITSPSIHTQLSQLCTLFVLDVITKDMGDWTESGYISASQADFLREETRHKLLQIRPVAVALVDAWDFSDHYLNSALGRWDGNVYECMYEWAQKAPLNSVDVMPAIETHLRPILSGKLKPAVLSKL